MAKTASFTTSDLLAKKKKLPTFIKGNALFQRGVKIEKIFPQVGLQDGSKDIIFKSALKGPDIALFIRHAIDTFNLDFGNKFKLTKLGASDLYITSRIKYKLQLIVNVLLNKEYTFKNHELFIKRDFYLEDRMLYKAGTNIFTIVRAILKEGSSYINNVHLIDPKIIHKELGKAKVHFSSSGLNGAWDILTMSMRGTRSCMRWGHNASLSLIGSILDPCCGIVYIGNSSKTEYGSKMLFRAIVRYVYNRETREPYLFLDKTYSHFYKNGNGTPLDKQIRKLFISFLEKAVKKKIKIIDVAAPKHVALSSLKIPRFSIINELREEQYSYRDYGIPYDDAEHSSSNVVGEIL